jgi:serine/threonine protein kinase
MTELWNRCEGQAVSSYLLGDYLGGSNSSAVYATGYGAEATPAAIKLIQADHSEWERQLAAWTTLTQLSHPRLIRLFDSGYSRIEGVPVLYVVMERADGSLSGVLPERPLTPVEAREMLTPALDALAYLHEHGFVHGGIKPSNIMAVGDEVKLSSDSITRLGELGSRRPSDECPAPELWDGVPSQAADVWGLGSTLVQALTQRPPDLNPGDSSTAVIPSDMPEPFRDIARHCLRRDPRSRWSLSQITSRLRGPQLVKGPYTPPPPEEPNPRSWVALYSIVAVVLAVVAVLLLVGRDRSPRRQWRPQLPKQLRNPPKRRLSRHGRAHRGNRTPGWWSRRLTPSKRMPKNGLRKWRANGRTSNPRSFLLRRRARSHSI